MKQYRLLLAAAVTTMAGLLSACGGGSDDDAGIPANTTYDVQAAMQRLLASGGTWSVAGRGNDGLDYRLVLSYAAQARATFAVDNRLYDRTQQTLTLRQGANASDTVSQDIYYSAATGAIAGTRYDSGECSVVAMTGTLPSAARAGEGGSYYRVTDYDDCTGATAVGVADASWSVEMNRGVPYFCVTTRYVTAGGLQVECIEALATDGTLGSRARVRLEVPIGSSTFVLDATT